MNTRLMTILAATLIGLAAPTALAVPQFVTYAGHLSDGTAWGQSLPGVTLTFALYDAETGGTQLWAQTFADVVVVDGAFSVVLGEGTSASGVALPVTDVFAEREAVWVAVSVAPPDGDDTDLTPRQQVGSVPYAARADRADRVEARVETRRYSMNAVFRGTTKVAGDSPLHVVGSSFDEQGATAGRVLLPGYSGYAAAKRACEIALDSETAHMCTTDEIARSAQLSAPTPGVARGWYWVATALAVRDEDSGTANSPDMITDCVAWTVNTVRCAPSEPDGWCGAAAMLVPDWVGGYYPCDGVRGIACCD